MGMVGKLMLSETVHDFVGYVRGKDASELYESIEYAYARFIVPDENFTKAIFLKCLLEIDWELFDDVVNHLFTPMNWSQIKARKFFAIKDSGSGNLITINMEDPNERYTLETCTVDDDNRPMLMTSHEEADLSSS